MDVIKRTNTWTLVDIKNVYSKLDEIVNWILAFERSESILESERMRAIEVKAGSYDVCDIVGLADRVEESLCEGSDYEPDLELSKLGVKKSTKQKYGVL